jgi:hypothetical protein
MDLPILIFHTIFIATRASASDDCEASHTPEWLTYEAAVYKAEVWRLIHPSERSLISISTFVSGDDTKYVIREKAPGQFELLRAQSKIHTYEFILNLASSCKLPISPAETVKLMNVQWNSISLTTTEFERLYKDFSKALSQYTSNVISRASKDGDRITLHSKLYIVSFDTAGFEEFEIRAFDARANDGKIEDPIGRWAAELMQLGSKTFKAN